MGVCLSCFSLSRADEGGGCFSLIMFCIAVAVVSLIMFCIVVGVVSLVSVCVLRWGMGLSCFSLCLASGREAVSIASLAVYDMCKAITKDITIDQIHLLDKTGGASGDYRKLDTE